MKKVTFNTAKALKKAGYPQNPYNDTLWFDLNGEQISDDAVIDGDVDIDAVCAAPTYFEAWLWLWRKKKICLEIEKWYAHESYIQRGCVCGTEQCGEFYTPEVADPEEAIIAAIEYLVNNNLIK